jgi:rRNA maturation endonuclease Nob1
MKRTVKSCHECGKVYMVFSNLVNGEFCKICRTKIQRKSKIKLSEYMELKFNN